MNHFMNNAKEIEKSKWTFTIHVYHGGEQPNETFYTTDIEEARKLAQRGEHSEIINANGIFVQ